MKPQIFAPLESLIGTLEMDMFESFIMDEVERSLKLKTLLFPESFMEANKNYSTMRNALLDSMTKGFNWNKYICGPDCLDHSFTPENYSNVRRRFTLAAIASWMTSSRRVMQMTEDLQLLLTLTSLEKTDWTMMEWPFDSFIISLATPMTYGTGIWERRCDAILIGRESKIPDATILFGSANEQKGVGEKSPFSIYFLRDGFKSLNECYSIAERSKLIKLARKNPYKANEIIHKNKERKWNEVSGWSSFYVSADIFKENGIISFIDESVRGYQNVGIDKILQVLFGSMLYMASLQKSRRANAENSGQWFRSKERPKTSTGRQIADASLIAQIGSEIRLCPDEKERFTNVAKLSKSDREISAHFRIGYFRRPPGLGNDPDAEKSVFVRPTIVRPDRLEKGSVPIGAVQKV